MPKARADAPAWPEAVRRQLAELPAAPGCYVYHGADDGVLYVGKAVNLRNRVRSYFQPSARHGARIARLVTKVERIETITVDSELEALVLECNLIKQHRPPFNVRLRDDKSYPYIAITKERFPRVIFTRRPRGADARVFGPFTSAWAVRDTLRLLHRVFPLIPCGKSWSGRAEQRPCLYHHLGQCLAPCAGLADPAEYAGVLEQVERFLSGRDADLLDDVRAEMESAAENLDFERAATLRDRLQALEAVREKQKVLSADGSDRDVIAVVRDDRGSAIQMLYVRGGKLIGQRQFILDGSAESAPGEAVQEFVKQYYADAPEIPQEVLLPVEIEERAIVQQWLRARRGSAMSVEVPRGGDRLRLVEMAATNAEQALSAFRQEAEQREAWAEEAMEQLGEALGLPAPPMRVEGYDISNTQGSAPVASMVVAENGEAAKAEYRRFRVKWSPESPNDFAMMHEAILRRLRRYLDGDPKFASLPDLILIDGGKGQLSAALRARDQLGLTVPMVGLAKRQEILFVPEPVRRGAPAPENPPGGDVNGGDGEGAGGEGAPDAYTYREVVLPMTSPGLLLLRRLRDEAHRFALTYHRKLRDKRMTGSTLDEVPGIGPRRRRMLLRTFGSLEAIRQASLAELAAVPTMTAALAARVKDVLEDGS